MQQPPPRMHAPGARRRRRICNSGASCEAVALSRAAMRSSSTARHSAVSKRLQLRTLLVIEPRQPHRLSELISSSQMAGRRVAACHGAEVRRSSTKITLRPPAHWVVHSRHRTAIEPQMHIICRIATVNESLRAMLEAHLGGIKVPAETQRGRRPLSRRSRQLPGGRGQ